MKRDDVFAILRAHPADLDQQSVKALAVFGSVARDEASPDSDVDLLVEFSRPVGLFEFLRLKRLLESWLGRPVDLATPDALHPALRDRILKEARYVR